MTELDSSGKSEVTRGLKYQALLVRVILSS